MNKENKILVISVGGSLIVPNKIDIDFLKKFKSFIEEQTNNGWRFVIVAGGGWTAREYQGVARKLGNPTNIDLDMLGIHATRINAFLLKTLLSDICHKEIVLNPPGEVNFNGKVLIAAEENPGVNMTSDFGTVKMAEYVDTNIIVNLTDVDYVYDRNPKKYKDAKPIKKMNWKDFLEILPDDLESGGHAPFGVLASKEANKHNFKVIIMNGSNLKEFGKYLSGQDFKGTIISN